MADSSDLFFNMDVSALLRALPDFQLTALLRACNDEILRRVRTYEG